MKTNRPRGLLLATIAGALLASSLPSLAVLNLKWDPAPAEDGAVTYAVEKQTPPSTAWVLVAETKSPAMGISSTPASRTLYRLKITSDLTGLSVYDSTVIADRPTADLNFRIHDPGSASIENSLGDPVAMLAAFEAAIHEPDPETPSFDLFEAFLSHQAAGKTPFRFRGPERPETFAALFRDS